MRFLFCLTLLILTGNPLLGLAQGLNPGINIAACFHQVDISSDEPAVCLADYFVRELGLKLKDRPLDIKFYRGSQDSFDLWVSSLNYPYIFIVDVTEQGWMINRPFSIPFIFNIYRSSYMIKAYVKFFNKDNLKLLLNKRYYVKVNGREAYQILYNDPNDGELAISFGNQKLIQEHVWQKLIRNVANDVYNILKRGG